MLLMPFPGTRPPLMSPRPLEKLLVWPDRKLGPEGVVPLRLTGRRAGPPGAAQHTVAVGAAAVAEAAPQRAVCKGAGEARAHAGLAEHTEVLVGAAVAGAVGGAGVAPGAGAGAEAAEVVSDWPRRNPSCHRRHPRPAVELRSQRQEKGVRQVVLAPPVRLVLP